MGMEILIATTTSESLYDALRTSESVRFPIDS